MTSNPTATMRTVKTIQKKRALTNQDQKWRLTTNKGTSVPHASGMAIRLNSTYLEVVDGNYQGRGAMSTIGIFTVSIGMIGLLTIFNTNILNKIHENNHAPTLGSLEITSTIYPSILFLSMIYFSIFINIKIGEWFKYTHYPIRLNRQNRMVYVFRGDGTTLEASWDNVYFTLHVVKKIAGVTWYGISGLTLKDAKTVEEQFMFGFSSSDQSDCLRHWEFIRCYMEEGPRAASNSDGLPPYLPIADKKETPVQGWIELQTKAGDSDVLQFLMKPVFALFFIGRLVANATCKVPLWPADVEAACRIAPDDPYVCDSRLNPPGYV
ncbi:hypothetical protein GR157_16850 [Burkholderia sp. 4701]|nr:hypothetical protein [Burkholderia sp. 4701]MXN83125.1 hypothetical protein [Burkholderia sp. 4812]